MEKLNKLFSITIILLLSSVSYAQKLDISESKHIQKTVQKLNTPNKMWVNGSWKIKNNGTRIWQKGHWKFEEKTFQQKSQLFRQKFNNRV